MKAGTKYSMFKVKRKKLSKLFASRGPSPPLGVLMEGPARRNIKKLGRLFACFLFTCNAAIWTVPLGTMSN